MCIKQGAAVLFEIANGTSYPVYVKDSILNTNPNFDYGPFLELQKTIQQGSTVIKAFSYIFNQKGIMVFSDSVDSNKLTIIGVVAENEECSNKDTNVEMITV